MKLTHLLLLAALLPLAGVPDAVGGPVTTGNGTLTIECVNDYKGFCGAPTDPQYTGFPEVSSTCDPAPVLTYQDFVTTPTTCPANRFQEVITRVWTATDSCGNTATCTQVFHIVNQVWALDIKPGSCPNPVNVSGGGGVVSVAIVGRPGQDVNDIIPGTIRIWRMNCDRGPLAPIDWVIEDVATPWPGGKLCNCHALGGDGIPDLRMRFDKQALVQALGLADEPRWSNVRLAVTADLQNGCRLIALDCVRVQ